MKPDICCDVCKFSIQAPGGRYECRRFPPQFHPLTALPLVPHVKPDFWCGEFVEWKPAAKAKP